jgi:hypothetical protein
MMVKLKLVSERKSFLNHFTYPKILGTFLLMIVLPTFFVIPFLSKNHLNWSMPYFICLTILFVFSWVTMYLKYFSSYDYLCIGEIIFYEDKIILDLRNSKKEIDLSNNSVTLLYNGIRKRGFQFGRDFPRSGIFELIINGVERHYSIINNFEDLKQMKSILNIWYRKKFHIEEFTRTNEEYRLIEFESSFDWDRLQEIKANKTQVRI